MHLLSAKQSVSFLQSVNHLLEIHLIWGGSAVRKHASSYAAVQRLSTIHGRCLFFKIRFRPETSCRSHEP